MEYGFTLDNDLLLSLMPQKMPMLLCEKVMLMADTKECNLGCGFFTVGDRECAVLDECNNLPAYITAILSKSSLFICYIYNLLLAIFNYLPQSRGFVYSPHTFINFIRSFLLDS